MPLRYEVDAPETPAIKVLFCDLSSQHTNQICIDLIAKMAQAIKLEVPEYLLCDLETSKQYPEVSCVVALASNKNDIARIGKWFQAKSGADVVYIHHPLKMIADPKFKIETWKILQQVTGKIQ